MCRCRSIAAGRRSSVTLERAIDLLKKCADDLLERPGDLEAWVRFVEAFELVTRVRRA